MKFFQSSQISEYDVATILLLKALKFEQNKDEDEVNIPNQLLRGNSSNSEKNSDPLNDECDDKLIDEPCKTIWKIN